MLNVQAKNLGAVAVLSLQGQIVIGQTDVLRYAFESLPPANSVILDLSRVSIVDAHGLGVMLQLRAQAEAEGVRFELMNVSSPLSKIFEITHLDSVFKINSGVEIFPRLVHPRRAPVAA
jgi:anti-anti-sigma factor